MTDEGQPFEAWLEEAEIASDAGWDWSKRNRARREIRRLVARVEELEEARDAALAVLPRKRNPHPDDAKQKLVNLAGGLLED